MSKSIKWTAARRKQHGIRCRAARENRAMAMVRLSGELSALKEQMNQHAQRSARFWQDFFGAVAKLKPDQIRMLAKQLEAAASKMRQMARSVPA